MFYDKFSPSFQESVIECHHQEVRNAEEKIRFTMFRTCSCGGDVSFYALFNMSTFHGSQ